MDSLTEELGLAVRERSRAEGQLQQLAADLQMAAADKQRCEAQLTALRGQLHELAMEHDNLKEDFR